MCVCVSVCLYVTVCKAVSVDPYCLLPSTLVPAFGLTVTRTQPRPPGPGAQPGRRRRRPLSSSHPGYTRGYVCHSNKIHRTALHTHVTFHLKIKVWTYWPPWGATDLNGYNCECVARPSRRKRQLRKIDHLTGQQLSRGVRGRRWGRTVRVRTRRITLL